MPMKIQIKFPELPPAAVATIGGALQRLSAVEEAMRPYEDTDEGEAILAACAALRSCTLFARQTESSARGLLSNAREAIETGAEVAASAVRTDGHAGPGQYETAVERARDEIVERYTAEAWRRTLEAKQASADRQAKAAVGALATAKRIVEIGRTRAAGPYALRERTSRADLETMGAVKEEEAGKPPSAWLDTLEALIDSGDEHAETLYTIAVKLLAQEVVTMTHPRLRERLGTTGPDSPERRERVERERAAALRFLDRVRERAEELIPESLKLAALALTELQGIFIALLGYQALVVPRVAVDRRRSSGQATPLDVEPNWPMRLGLATAQARR